MEHDATREAVLRATEAYCERRAAAGLSPRHLEALVALTGYRREELEDVPEIALRLACGRGHPVDAAAPREGDVVVDVGCGVGLDLILASRHVGAGGLLVGVDCSPAMRAHARECLLQAEVEGVDVEGGLAEALPIADGFADVVVANGLLSLSPEPERVLREMARALRPGGCLAVADVMLLGDLPRWAAFSRGLFCAGVVGARTTSTLLSSLRDLGFVEVEVVRELPLDEELLLRVLESAGSGVEVAGCSASGAVMDSEAAAGLEGVVGLATLRAQKS